MARSDRNIRESLGYNVAARRLEMDLSVGELAERAGIERGFLVRLEAGRIDPSIDVVFSLADALGVTADDLMRMPGCCVLGEFLRCLGELTQLAEALPQGGDNRALLYTLRGLRLLVPAGGPHIGIAATSRSAVSLWLSTGWTWRGRESLLPAAWEGVVVVVAEFLSDARRAVMEARRRGLTPQQVLAIVQHYRTYLGARKPAFLHYRIRTARPAEEASDRWPE